MGFIREFPYNTGMFVVVDLDGYDENDPKTLLTRLGSITCYQCVNEDDELVVMVSGYRDSWCGAYFLNEIKIATKEEVNKYRELMGIVVKAIDGIIE